MNAIAASTTSSFSAAPTRRILRRTGAVFAGLVTIFVLSSAADAVLHATGVYSPLGVRTPDPLFLLALGYRIAFGILGCWVTARLAPDRPMQHAFVLGAIGVVLSTAGAVAMWDGGPAWYSLAVIATCPPCAWIAGKLRLAQLSR